MSLIMLFASAHLLGVVGFVINDLMEVCHSFVCAFWLMCANKKIFFFNDVCWLWCQFLVGQFGVRFYLVFLIAERVWNASSMMWLSWWTYITFQNLPIIPGDSYSCFASWRCYYILLVTHILCHHTDCGVY